MTAKEHYDNHLGNFYSWMTGDFSTRCNEFKYFLADNLIKPSSNKIAIDLGAGHGLQSIPLAEIGYHVLAVDFNQQLLEELKKNAKGLDITVLNDDIKQINFFANTPELVICCGDTLSHLDNKSEIRTLIADIAKSLGDSGKIILSFRDYSTELTGNDRFIHVKSDDSKILTCILEYEEEYVNVTDLLHEKINEIWVQKVSSYKKVRLLTSEIIENLKENGMTIIYNQLVNRLTTIIATKKNSPFKNIYL